ncbi:hypothetical protein AK830_g10839 [Neonectria ditissima]|uniref:AMMECR1 domain-containing protein n=1 Tax=Neonectria ditissima TaxID=78410 RepID=A0A0P7B4W9_9HYPO|nr:hypothetical protein AK830_g10839 [Neonectria ditissima]
MATTEHCLACFEALEAHLSHRKPLSLDEIQTALAASASSSSSSVASPPSSKGVLLQDPALRRLAADSESSSSSTTSLAASTPATSTSSLPLPPTSAPLFVTWNTMDDDDGEPSLRGCIGTFESQPLAEGIPEYSLVSALQDSRFPPIRKSELPTLQVAVTLLTDFEEVDDMYDWDVGVHGLRLSFYDRGRRYGSTYLPDVAAEQGWTKDETLFSLIRKAGWMGSRKHWKDLDLDVTRYQGKKSTLEYRDFKKWRAGLDT